MQFKIIKEANKSFHIKHGRFETYGTTETKLKLHIHKEIKGV
jgi:hypothetical protein